MTKPHCFTVKTFKPSSKPSGKCLYWKVKDGKAVQCGNPSEGQRCDSCKAKADSVSRQTRVVRDPLGLRAGRM